MSAFAEWLGAISTNIPEDVAVDRTSVEATYVLIDWHQKSLREVGRHSGDLGFRLSAADFCVHIPNSVTPWVAADLLRGMAAAIAALQSVDELLTSTGDPELDAYLKAAKQRPAVDPFGTTGTPA